MNPFLVGLEKVYSDNLLECSAALTHVAAAGVTSVSWRSDSDGETEDGPSVSKGRRSGIFPRHLEGGKIGGYR